MAWLARYPKLTSWVEETMTYFRLPLVHRKTRLPDAPNAASGFLQAFCYVLLIPNVALIFSENPLRAHAKTCSVSTVMASSDQRYALR
jgi:hypothetical protein